MNNFKNIFRNSRISRVCFLATTKTYINFSSILLKPQYRIMATNVYTLGENKPPFERSDKIAHFKQDGNLNKMSIVANSSQQKLN